MTAQDMEKGRTRPRACARVKRRVSFWGYLRLFKIPRAIVNKVMDAVNWVSHSSGYEEYSLVDPRLSNVMNFRVP
jgi:hypothetical protein